MDKSISTNNRSNGLEMYFNRAVAEKFAALEQNEKNYEVAQAVDQVITAEIKNTKDPLHVCELCAGAHPDKYDKLFERLLREPKGQIDWVDISPIMLELAKSYISNEEYRKRFNVINFIEEDALVYLKNAPSQKLDLAIMKYAIDFIENIDLFFNLLFLKLKPGGILIATIGMLSPELKSISTNARFLFNGKEFPENETRTLNDGDEYTIKFFNVSGNPSSGYLEGAQTNKFFHCEEKIITLAEKYKFDFFLGDWKKLVGEQNGINLDILILRKPK